MRLAILARNGMYLQTGDQERERNMTTASLSFQLHLHSRLRQSPDCAERCRISEAGSGVPSVLRSALQYVIAGPGIGENTEVRSAATARSGGR